VAVSVKGNDMAIDDETRERARKFVNKETSNEEMEKASSGMSPTKTDFKSAFAAARKGGESTFEWNGKKYTTEMASAKPAAKAEVGPTRSKSAAPDTYGVPSLTPNADRTEQSSVNDRLGRFASGFPGGSPLASIAAIAGPTAGGLARGTGKFLGSLGSSGRAEAAAAKSAEAAAKSGSTKQGLREPTPFKRGRTRSVKQESDRDSELDAIRMTGRYAKGGKVSSASSRGDGIATKGKTRGRMC
jgi:hypothetical protein